MYNDLSLVIFMYSAYFVFLCWFVCLFFAPLLFQQWRPAPACLLVFTGGISPVLWVICYVVLVRGGFPPSTGHTVFSPQ